MNTQTLKLNPVIQISSGYWNISEPERQAPDILSIAHSLSGICRFTGHTGKFYSVAEHSVRCSYIHPEQDAFAKLMHDVAESVLGDVSSPLKQLLCEYKVLERKTEAVLFRWFGVSDSHELPKSVKHADLIMLVAEKRDLMPRPSDDGLEWKWLADHDIPELSCRIRPWSRLRAKHAFLSRFYELCPGEFLMERSRTWLRYKHAFIAAIG